jgi:hypothetical protein
MIWFYCVIPAPDGGETTIADGAHIMSNFSEATADMLRRRRIQYERRLDDGVWQTSFHTSNRDEVEELCRENSAQFTWGRDGSLTTTYTCHAFIHDGEGREVFINDLLPVAYGEIAIRQGLVPELKGLRPPLTLRWEDGSELEPDILEEIAETALENEIAVPAQAGDILMIDNTRILHGRRQSYSADRKVLARMGAPNFGTRASNDLRN